MKSFHHRKLFSLAILGVAALSLAGCSQKKDNSASAKKTVSVSSNASISTMDSSLNTTLVGAQELSNTMEGLYRYSGNKLEPGVAKSIAKPTDGGKKYTIDLKKTKWSNGDSVTANDFVYAWQRMVDPKTASQYSYIYSGVKNADDIVAGKKKPDTLGIKALNKYKLQVTLEHPIPYFDTLVSGAQFYPLNKKAVTASGSNYGITSKGMVFNGPYKLENWKAGDTEWHDTKNNSYWNAKNVKTDQLKWYVITDPNTGLNLYDTNMLDRLNNLGGDAAHQLSNNKDFSTTPQNSTYYLETNEKKFPFMKNKKLRQAMALSINRDELSNIILGKTGIPAHSVVPQDMSKNPKTGVDFTDEPSAKADRKYTNYDPAKATKLWQEGLKETGQKNVDFTFTTDDTDTTKKMSEYIQDTMQKNLPGLKITLSNVPFKTRVQRQSTKNFDMIGAAWIADYPDPTNFLDLFTKGNPNNDGSWENAQYDKYVKNSETKDVNNPEKRWNDMLAAQSIITKEQGAIPVYQNTNAALTKQNVKGFEQTPTGLYNMVDVYKK